MRAVAPPGGCKVCVRYITKIDRPTESPNVKKLVPMVCTRITAIVADKRCPPIKFLGCDKGASGTAKRRTAVAPKDPMSRLCPDRLVMSKIDQMAIVLLTKLQMANRKESLFRFARSGAFIL